MALPASVFGSNYNFNFLRLTTVQKPACNILTLRRLISWCYNSERFTYNNWVERNQLSTIIEPSTFIPLNPLVHFFPISTKEKNHQTSEKNDLVAIIIQNVITLSINTLEQRFPRESILLEASPTAHEIHRSKRKRETSLNHARGRATFSPPAWKGRAKCVDEARRTRRATRTWSVPLWSPLRRGHLFSYLRAKATPKRRYDLPYSSRIKDRREREREILRYELRSFSGVG